MIWVVSTAVLTLISLYHWQAYHQARKIWQSMQSVDGQLLAYHLKAQNKRLKRLERLHTTRDIEHITKNPTVVFSYEYQGKVYQSSQLCLLDEVKTAELKHYLQPKPINIQVRINPQNPQQAALHLGRLSPINVFSYYLAAAFLLLVGFNYFG